MALLIADNRDIIGLTILLSVTVLANVLVHWFAICPRLYRHGARFPAGLCFWRVLRELRTYRELTSARGQTLTFYYLDFILSWFSLLLVLALVLRLLWVQTHPDAF
jgi:hypothetical protein